MFKKESIIRFTSFVLLSLSGACCAWGQEQKSDSIRIHFRTSQAELEPDFRNNRQALFRMTENLRKSHADSLCRLRRIEVTGSASPEGATAFNRKLSEKRAAALSAYLSAYQGTADFLKTIRIIGSDWNGLLRLAEADPDLPFRNETLDELRRIAAAEESGPSGTDNSMNRLKQFKGGVPYRYLLHNLFPLLRASQLTLWYEKVYIRPLPAPLQLAGQAAADFLPVRPAPAPHAPARPFYMAVKTNLLYDAVLVPNIGVEFYLGKNWSLSTDWMYSWWSSNRKHNYWRIYGGDIELRRWWGKAASRKPLSGHHLGVYAQTLTYDFELGGRGYMGGEPGGDIFDRAHWGAGIAYGYALPVAHRLNIDFSVAVGYLGGTYYEYLPEGGCYTWQATKKRHYFGPTKLEVSLVWLIGRGNVNHKKGGRK